LEAQKRPTKEPYYTSLSTGSIRNVEIYFSEVAREFEKEKRALLRVSNKETHAPPKNTCPYT
jgi:hypothetical protein